jgi:hypothetical protein
VLPPASGSRSRASALMRAHPASSRLRIESEFPHSGQGVSYHLFEVTTERELEFYALPTDNKGDVLPGPDPNKPKWVDELNASTFKG